MDMVEMQRKYVEFIIAKLPPGWDVIKIHFEYITVDEVQHNRYVCEVFTGEERTDFAPPFKATTLLTDANDNIPVGQERWTWIEITIYDGDRYNFDYRYGAPPLLTEGMARAKAYAASQEEKRRQIHRE
jgi:hypothetical protein